MTTPIALTIAGSDSSGGAGIQADLKSFAALGVYGASVITALTAQNTQGVTGIHQVPADFVTAQIDAVFSDLDIGAVKIGMVAEISVIGAIAAGLAKGEDLQTAVRNAKAWVSAAIAAADRFAVGHGHGPIHHFNKYY